MNLKVFQFYRIPNPLKENEKVIVSDDNIRASLRNASWEFHKGSTITRPKILRLVISPDKSDMSDNNGGPSGKINLDGYLKALKRKEDQAFNRRKLKECMKLLRSLIIGYLLYIAPPAFWEPIETVFDAVAHGMSDYAKWWVIIFFPAKGFIRTFGTGIHFPLPAALIGNAVFRRIPLLGKIRNIGTTGRWQAVNRVSRSTEIYSLFSGNLADEFSENINTVITNIKKKIKKQKRNSGDEHFAGESRADEFKKLMERLIENYSYMDSEMMDSWDGEYRILLEKVSEESRKGGSFPWGEIPKLDRLREDLVFFGGRNKFIFAPVREIHPDMQAGTGISFSGSNDQKGINDLKIIDFNLEIRRASALNQSISLEAFFASSEIKDIHRKIHSDYKRLLEAEQSGDGIRILDSLSRSFESLRDRISTLHLGSNMMIPREKGKDLTNFYHKLYLIFGRASCDLAGGYKKAGWGIRPIWTDRGVRLRIKEAVEDAVYLIENRKIHRSTRIRDRIVSFLGKWSVTGAASAVILLFLFGSLLSFYTLKPDETAVLKSLRLGYKGEFVNNELTSLEFGSGMVLPGVERELLWHPPPPLTSMNKISPSEPSEFTVHMVIGESHTNNPWKKFLQLMSGQLGMSFDVAELVFEYVPGSSDIWQNYNSDGRGYKRLIRDTSSIVEEWKTELLGSYEDGITSIEDTQEVNHIFTTFFKELSDKGVIEDFIRRSFSQTVLSTHVYYGSPLERYKPGFISVMDELDRRYEEYGRDPLLSIEEKTELQVSMNTAMTVVEETLERIESQVEIEYGDLRRHPDTLMNLVEDPYSHIQELRDFETLWSGIQSYTWHLYNQEKLKELFRNGKRAVVSGENVSDNDYVMDLLSKIGSDPHLSKLIKIKSLEFEVMDMGVSKLNLIQQKWKDII